MGIEGLARTIAQALLKTASPGDAGAVEPSDAVALPANGANPETVKAFRQAMDAGQPPLAAETDPTGQVSHNTALHFAGDMDPVLKKPVAGPVSDYSIQDATRDKMSPEAYIKTVTDILGKENLSHADLFRVQVLASVAKVEIIRNSRITQSLDNGMRTIIKSSS